MKHRVAVIAIVQQGDTILLGRKTAGRGPYPDTWHIPGGGVNLGEETCDEAMIREIREETGLEVTNLRKIPWDTDVEPDKHGEPTYYVFLAYHCDYASGTLASNDDLQHLEWVPIKELKNYELNRPNKILFTQMGYI